MTDRPILFSAPMVRALLEGRKTQTRRALKPQPLFDAADQCIGQAYASKIEIGDQLWVREAWRTNAMWDHMTPAELSDESRVWGRVSVLFEAGGALPGSVGPEDAGRYRHARFMPRWASRLTLLVTDVRVQRLQDISEADAMAEGVHGYRAQNGRAAFEAIWHDLHGPDAWAENPWVAAITFDVRHGNIDQVQP